MAHTLEQLRAGELKGITRLSLSCGLTEFPHEIFSLADTLEVLDLSFNQLSALPADFGKLSKLKIAFFSDNLFTELPEVLADCRELDMIGFKSNQIAKVSETALPVNTRWLILTNNKITALPRSIGKCLRLQKVALAGNQLTELPAEMANCRNLELLRISANQLNELPLWLLQLPKLAWLAFAGNPFHKTPTINSVEALDWNEFEIFEQLGEGASGHIYKAHWLNHRRDVAIKVFKGEVTSDGFPDDEMQACIAAGSHPNLVSLFGKIKNHPTQKQGIIMDLIPPSLVTCSRDTFKEGTTFTAQQIFKIARAIASAAEHLHARGLMHGDLYAHNILIDAEANALMGDFGAASFYDPADEAIQRVEVRAFGCLLDDLLMRLDAQEQDWKLVDILKKLKTLCMNEKVVERPLFKNIKSFLI